MSNRILVTGGTGTVGRELVKQLKARGADFSVMSSKPQALIDGVTLVQGDLSDAASLERAFTGFDTLFLLLPLVPNKVELATNALAAARRAGIKHIVRSSAAGADAASRASIGALQGKIDDLVKATGIAYTLLLPNAFMQNHITFNAGQIKSGALFAPLGEGAVSMVDVRDVAEVAATVLTAPAEHAGKSYVLTGGEALTSTQQMAAVSGALGREVKYVDVPEQAATDAMVKMGMPAILIDWLTSLNHVFKQGWASGVSGDVQKLTGHAPRTFAAFATEHANAWR
jgi:NAD(P)H dehydrogenase (quinone)